jgi:outer membrane receptor protein involved in Fe transport
MAMAVALAAAPVVAQAQDRVVDFNIPAEQVSEALADFARQAGVQVLGPTGGLQAVRVPALRGRMEILAALDRLLAGTPLRVGSANRSVIVLKLVAPSAGPGPSAPSRAPRLAPRPVATARPSDRSSPPAAMGETIVVTGSRLLFGVNDNPSPVTSMDAEFLRDVVPAPLPEAVNLLPAFSGSRGPTSNPTSTGTVGAGNAAANQLNLRNLGANRNLILFNGIRVPPTLTNGVVDVDMIPQRLVKRVDVATGGVSAVYGSDAITGVVNFALDENFTGLQAEARAGISAAGDDAMVNASVAYGAGLLDGRGHFEASYEYRDDAGIPFRSDRAWNNLWAVEGAGTPENPFRLYSNVHLPDTPFGGLITTGPLAGQTFADGALRPLVHGTPTGSACCEIGGEGGFYDSSMKASLRSHQVFARFDFAPSPRLGLFVQAAGNIKRNASFADPLVLSNATMSVDNPFLPTAAAERMRAAGLATFGFSEMVRQGPRLGAVADSSQWMFTAGLKGEVRGSRWSLSFTRGSTRLRTLLTGNVNNQRLAAALDAVTDPASGQIVCAANAGGANRAPGCFPLNLFGPDTASPAALGYVFRDTALVANTRQDDLAGQVQAAPFRTAAGPVQLAVSAEWRRQTFRSRSEAETTLEADCTGLRYNCNAQLPLWRETFSSSPAVSQSVAEAAVELNVPVLRDVPLARALSINGAARFTHYDTSGDYWTWKLGLNWQVSRDLRLHATRSRDIRAPTLSDLFSPRFKVARSRPDLLTNTTVDVPTSNQGNPAIRAEIGASATLGLVWSPAAVPGLQVSVEGFRTVVSDAITTVQGFAPAVQAACYASGGSSPYCALQDRPRGYADTSPGNAVTAWRAMYINIARIETWGADLELGYRARLFGWPVQARLLGTWQPHIYYRQPGIDTIDQGGVAFGALGLAAAPSLRLTATLAAQVSDGVQVTVLQRWRNRLQIDGAGLTWIDNRIAAFATTALAVSIDTRSAGINGVLKLNVQNLFDADPPGAAYSGFGSIPGARGGWAEGDNPVGRYFTAAFALKF